MNNQPKIAITPGDPAGIGPDLCLQIAQKSHQARLILYCDSELIQDRAKLLGLEVKLIEYNPDKLFSPKKNLLEYIPIQLNKPSIPGKADSENARYVLETITQATAACAAKKMDALVTGPVNKSIINQAGIAFTGHTEFLATLTNSKNVVMMFVTPEMKLALVTTHLPLSKVSEHITKAALTQTLLTTHQALQKLFHIDKPVIYVSGLNPHAGEDGHLGTEEITIIQPVIHQLKQQSLNCIGPLPADTLFTPDNIKKADAFITMYHDQGLPVIKYAGFGNAVNLTLGLPFIRTSVDHGTAFKLAGTGNASSQSLLNAIHLATRLTTANNVSTSA